MNSFSRMFVTGATILMLALPLTITAQWNKKPYTEWSEKEALKLLNDSPWAQTQTVTDTSKQSSTTRSGSGSTTAIADIISINFRVRFFSAKPTRQAIARVMELQQKGKLPEQMAAQLKALAGADFPDFIIVTVSVESDKPSNMMQQANAALSKLTTSELKNDTYLVIRDGKRLFLKEYQRPRNDGLGARFIFQRLQDGEPFISERSEEILFHAEILGGSAIDGTIPNSDLPNRDASGRTAAPFGFTINTRYKVKDMLFNGKLEY
jgi:hypothetical protein